MFLTIVFISFISFAVLMAIVSLIEYYLPNGLDSLNSWWAISMVIFGGPFMWTIGIISLAIDDWKVYIKELYDITDSK